jgi:hypothetical protein
MAVVNMAFDLALVVVSVVDGHELFEVICRLGQLLFAFDIKLHNQ